MTDRRPESLNDRVTRLEVLFENLGIQIKRELEIASNIHADLGTSIQKLTELGEKFDARQDKTDLRIAYALGAVATIVVLFQFFAPVLRSLFGLPNT